MNRRTFLKWAGVGAVTFAANPIKLIDKLDITKEPASVTSEPVDLHEYVDVGYNSWASVTEANGTIYAIGQDNKVLTSTDQGITWNG